MEEEEKKQLEYEQMVLDNQRYNRDINGNPIQQNAATNVTTPPVVTTPPPAIEKPRSTSWNMFRNVFGRDPITPEEEQRRMRKARTASMIGNLGNAIAAFANLFYASKGAPAAQVPDAIQPDYKGFQDRVMAERAKAYELQRQQEATDLANQRYEEEMTLKKQQQQDAIKYNNSRLAAQKEHNLALEEIAREKNAQQKINAENKQTNDVRRLNIAQQNANANSTRVSKMENKSTPTGSGKSSVYKGGRKMYNLPLSADKTRMEDAIIRDMIKRGIIDENNYIETNDGRRYPDRKRPKKTKAELVKLMHERWDGKAENILKDYGGSVEDGRQGEKRSLLPGSNIKDNSKKGKIRGSLLPGK